MLAATIGCNALPEVAYVTERVEVAPSFASPICEGTLDDLDGQVERIEDELGHTPDLRPMRLYWIEDGIDEFCGEGRGGCYYPSTRVLFASGWSIDHELVHAILDSEGESYFIEEGMAELLSGVGVVYEPEPGSPGPAERLRLSRSAYRKGGLDYAAAAHFMHFVYDESGSPAVIRLGREVAKDPSPGQLESVLEAVMHDSVDTIESRYQTWAPRYYPGLAQSRVPELEIEAPTTDIEVVLDCDDVSTRGPRPGGEPGMYQVYRVRIPWHGLYRLELDGESDGWLDVFDPYARLTRGWVTDWTRPDRSLDPDAARVHAGDELELELHGGTHLFVFASEGTDAAALRLRIATPDPPDPVRDAD